MLKDYLDRHCMLSNLEAKMQNADVVYEEPSFSMFDFFYLPMDFVTRSNKGYAFVNFTNPIAARKFYDEWHDIHWDCFKSNKILQIYCAKLQGVKIEEQGGGPCHLLLDMMRVVESTLGPTLSFLDILLALGHVNINVGGVFIELTGATVIVIVTLDYNDMILATQAHKPKCLHSRDG
ncbi:hypothetical protein V6N11_038141 [Hibiscus sabdariffa]|uniref:Mei2-like C-terminal RNA recognition motif domain-containing protein n=1 Tax=Hibiscus sabdariffa TaxID=183260 RepID=A0ABR2SJ38_9ROSI